MAAAAPPPPPPPCDTPVTITAPAERSSVSADGHFNVPEGTTTIVSRSGYLWDEERECLWEQWGVDKKAVKTVTIPESVSTIGVRAFFRCSSLASIAIPDSVTAIGSDAFCGCSSLASITIPDSVATIGDSAFSGCSSLATITLPDHEISIAGSAFDGCSAIPDYIRKRAGHFNIPEGTTTIVSRLDWEEEGECSWIEWGVDKSAVKTVTIPDSVTTIEHNAFQECSSLASITIPDSVTGIKQGAFQRCASLTSITIPDSVTSIGDSAFYGCNSLASITIPNSVTSIGWEAFNGCSSLASITIPDSVTTIGRSAFLGCSSLASIAIPDSVTAIERFAFAACSSLASIAIPDSVTTIGEDAFGECTSLVSITIPESVTAIGTSAFEDCRSLASIIIPDSVTTIGEFAFNGCSSLASVTISDSVTAIGGHAFSNCANLATLIAFTPPPCAPAVLAIDSSAFVNCSNIKRISAPDHVVAALKEPYAGCTTLASLPPRVTYRAAKLQLDTYFWSMIIHRNTNRLSIKQRAWVKHLLTVGSRVRLHWRPFNKGPRSVACIPTPGHPPLPCIMNDIWLLVLKFVKLSELRPSPATARTKSANAQTDPPLKTKCARTIVSSLKRTHAVGAAWANPKNVVFKIASITTTTKGDVSTCTMKSVNQQRGGVFSEVTIPAANLVPTTARTMPATWTFIRCAKKDRRQKGKKQKRKRTGPQASLFPQSPSSTTKPNAHSPEPQHANHSKRKAAGTGRKQRRNSRKSRNHAGSTRVKSGVSVSGVPDAIDAKIVAKVHARFKATRMRVQHFLHEHQLHHQLSLAEADRAESATAPPT